MSLSKNLFNELKDLVNKITLSQEEYALSYGKNESIKSDSIKRKERIQWVFYPIDTESNLIWHCTMILSECLALLFTATRC